MNESIIFTYEKEKQKIRRKLEMIEKCLGLDHRFVNSKSTLITETPKASWITDFDHSNNNTHLTPKDNDWRIQNKVFQQEHVSAITKAVWENATGNSSYSAIACTNNLKTGIKPSGVKGVVKDFSNTNMFLRNICKSRQNNNLVHSSYTAQKWSSKEPSKRPDTCKRKFIFWNNQYKTQNQNRNKVSHMNYSNNTRNNRWRTTNKGLGSKFGKEASPSLHPRTIKKVGNPCNYQNSSKNSMKPGCSQSTDDLCIKPESVSPIPPDDRSVNYVCNNDICDKMMTFHLTQVSEDSCLFNADSSIPIFLNFQLPNKKCKCCGHTATKADSNITSMYMSTESCKSVRPGAKSFKPKIDSEVLSVDHSKKSDIGTKKKERSDLKMKKQDTGTTSKFTPIVNSEFPQTIQLLISPASEKQCANTNDEPHQLDKPPKDWSIAEKEDLTDVSQITSKDPSISDQQFKTSQSQESQDQSKISQSCQTMYTCHQSSDGFMILRLYDADYQSKSIEVKQTKDTVSESTPNSPKSCKSDDTISTPQTPARNEGIKLSEQLISASPDENTKTHEKVLSNCQHLQPSQSKCCHKCCCDTNHCADCSCCKPADALPKPSSCFDNAIAGPITQVFDVPSFDENYKDLQLATKFNLDGTNITSLNDVQLLLDIRIEKIMDESSDQEQEVQKKHKRGYANSTSDD